MSTPLICYILVGTPGSGKSTLAAKMVEHNPEYWIVSTDEIRAELFGDASIQGNWLEIETQVLRQIQQAIASGNPIIYDATNFKRPWRIDLLGKLAELNVYWVALHLQTPLECCILWNQQRQRQVPEIIIEKMAQCIETFPPIEAEGFAKVYSVVPTEIDSSEAGSAVQRRSTLDLQKIFCAKTLANTITNRRNRSKNVTLHRYSRLLDFERLMHLIALIIKYPGVGNLQATSPEWLQQILGTTRYFTQRH